MCTGTIRIGNIYKHLKISQLHFLNNQNICAGLYNTKTSEQHSDNGCDGSKVIEEQ